jgi:hypothetical protein
MLFIISTPVLIRHLWQLKTAVFLHRCLICTVLLRPKLSHAAHLWYNGISTHEFNTILTNIQSYWAHFVKKWNTTMCLSFLPSLVFGSKDGASWSEAHFRCTTRRVDSWRYKNSLGWKVKLGTNVPAYLTMVSGTKINHKLPHKIYFRD